MKTPLHKRNSRKLRSFTLGVLTFLLSVQILIPLILPNPAYAQAGGDFEINTDYTISYEPGNDFVQIKETLSLKVLNSRYYIPSQEERTFILTDFSLQRDPNEREFKKASLTVTDRSNIPLKTELKDVDSGIELTVKNNREVSYGTEERIIITYNTHELIDRNGNIINLYIPGLPEDTEFQKTEDKFGLKTNYNFTTSLNVPNTAPTESFTYPQGKIKVSERNDRKIFTIDARDRLGQTAWIQLGNIQYYYFKIIQPTAKTDNIIPEEVSKYTSLLSTNVYKIPLPKEDTETNQKVFFRSLSPAPSKIEVDPEGNFLATFEVPANKESEIIIEGYITIDSSKSIKAIPDFNFTEYYAQVEADPTLKKYTLPDEYWETNSQLVRTTAQDILLEAGSLTDLIDKNYNFVIDRLNYSYEKVNGNNVRLGALATLEGGPAVCMEYSDTLIALFRSQGIPARAAIGYGNDPTGAENRIGSTSALAQNIGHQWLQIWVPDYGWLSIDPTWGESGRRYIGPNLDHILWYTVGDSEVGYVGTSLSTADPVSQHVLSSYDVYLQALSESDYLQSNADLLTLQEISMQYKNVADDQLTTFIKTTSIGKVGIIIVPVVIVLFFLYFVASLFIAIFRSIKFKRQNKY